MSVLTTYNITDGSRTLSTNLIVKGGVTTRFYAEPDASLTGSDVNVTSSTDHGIGDYSFSLTNSYPNAFGYVQSGVVRDPNPQSVSRNPNRHTASVAAIETFTTVGSNLNASANIALTGSLA